MLSDSAPGVRSLILLVAVLFAVAVLHTILPISSVWAAGEDTCSTGKLTSPGTGKALLITKPCTVGAGTYHYGEVNILGSNGSLQFGDTVTDFYASSILIQAGGSLLGGVVNPGPNETIVPIGTAGGKLTIHLYGAEAKNRANGQGVLCKDDSGTTDLTCGVPKTIALNTMSVMDPGTCAPSVLPGPVTDCFYKYDSLKFDGGGGNLIGYFGYKVIGLSFGGVLRLYGKKGADYSDTKTGSATPPAVTPSSTGTSWQRLDSCPGKKTGDIIDPADMKTVVGKCQDGVLQPVSTDPMKLNSATQIKLSGPSRVDWQPMDWIVLSTTDYLVSHSEKLQVKSVAADGLTITLMSGLQYPHNASIFDVAGRIANSGRTGLTDLTSVDTRAAVGLLTRSIRIVSQGATFTDALPAPTSPDLNRYFGGHLIVRQGFQQLQLQGVEMFQMGQGGKIGHYPVHFHMTRKVPANTFIKDCSIWDSFTRWIVLHATQGVLLARNVGYRSIGHGYYLEDGTETNNQLYANLGVSAIAAVNDNANYRSIPGILVARNKVASMKIPPAVPVKTDSQVPTIFWMMNGWNDVEYNMAAGAEACGMCYWYVPGANSGGSRMMNWTTQGTPYASEQRFQRGITPIQKFLGNTCSTALASISTIGDISPCNGVGGGGLDTPVGGFTPIDNVLLSDDYTKDPTYYPLVSGTNRLATLCNKDGSGDHSNDCSTVLTCADTAQGNCAVTTLDHYTTSFNYAETNFSAIWMRPQWNLVINSAITDILNAGVTFVTGGGYTRSDAQRGMWSLARKSVFIGNTQTTAGNSFATNAGPVNPTSTLTCRDNAGNFCIPSDTKGSTKDYGTVFQLSNFSTSQRLFNVYDGPSLEDSNVFLDITPTMLVDKNGNNDCTSNAPAACENAHYMQGRVLGVPGIPTMQPTPPAPAARPTTCYLPNAAIAWKQPNGFYYPPAFHSDNLFFNNVDIRHYVIEARFLTPTDAKPYPYKTDLQTSLVNFCNANETMWNGFTDVDRQTELSDDDGSLTGLIKTISVNANQFFSAPTQALECKSDIPDLAMNQRATAKTSPYDYVTAVVYADECSSGDVNSPYCDKAGLHTWSKACTNESCFGVPLHRELMVQGETLPPPLIHMGGQRTGQRSTLIPNNMRYYMETSVSQSQQQASAQDLNVFEPKKTYHVMLLFAKPQIPAATPNQTVETFDVFVGKGLDSATFLPTVHAEKANLNGQQYKYVAFDNVIDSTKSPWMDVNPASGKWVRSYNSGTGMLTVTMDMSLSNFTQDYNNSISGRCQPLSMCQWLANAQTGQQCQCNTNSTLGGYIPGDCSSDIAGICKWAVADIDYPDAGAYAFSFTLPDSSKFVYGPQKVPNSTCLTLANNGAQWNVPFAVPSPAIAGDCAYNTALPNTPPAPVFSMNSDPTNGCK